MFIRFPFNWHNPFGYTASVSFEYAWGVVSLFTIICQTNCLVGTCLMLISLSIDISNELLAIDSRRLDVRKRLNHIIGFHSDAKKLSAPPTIFSNFSQVEIKWVPSRRTADFDLVAAYIHLDSLSLNNPNIDYSRLVQMFFEAYKFNIMTYFLWSTLTICSTLLMIQIQLVE